MKGTKQRKEFSIERQIGTFGLKSKIKMGFAPGLSWPFLSTNLPGADSFGEFYLILELHCPADIKEWKGASSKPKFCLSFGWGEKCQVFQWYRREPSELKKLIRSCPALSRYCLPLRLNAVLKELKMKGFWFKVVGENE